MSKSGSVQRLSSVIPTGSVYGNLTGEQRQLLVRLETLTDVPKVAFSTRLAMTVYPANKRMRKTFWSHIELYKMVETTAGVMRELGVKPRSVVAVAAPNSFESIILFLAVQWTGAIIVIIDPAVSVEQMKTTLRETQAAICVSPLEEDEAEPNFAVHNNVAQATKALGIIHWSMYTAKNEGFKLETRGLRAADRPAWHGGNKDLTLDPLEISIRVLVPVEGKHLLLSLTQANICNAVKKFSSHYDIKHDQATLWVAPIYTLQGILTLLATLYMGGSLIVPRYGAFESETFWATCKDDKVKWVSLSSDQVLALYDYTKKNPAAAPKDLTLEFIRSCPGSLPPSQISAMESLFKAPVLEAYGPPEASGIATGNREHDFMYGSLGKPVRDVSVAIVDVRTKTKVGANHSGEIAVRGGNVVMSGYDNNADESALSKVTIDEEDFVMTGDRGKLNDDGYLILESTDRILKSGALAKQRELEAAAAAERDAEEARRRAEEAHRRKQADDAEAARLADEARRRKEAEDARRAAALAATAAAAPAPAPVSVGPTRAPPKEEYSIFNQRSLPKEKTAAPADEAPVVAPPVSVDPDTTAALMAALKALQDEERAMKEEYERQSDQAVKDSDVWRVETEKRLTAQADMLRQASGLNDGMDVAFFKAVNARLKAIEKRTATLEKGLNRKHEAEIAEMQRQIRELERQKAIAEHESMAARNARGIAASTPVLMEVNMTEIEASVMAAADAAEQSDAAATRGVTALGKAKETSNPDEATKLALEAAAAANRAASAARAAASMARSVVMQPPTPKVVIDEQKVIGKTPDEYKVEKRVRVNLEDIENAMKSHPGVKNAMAYGSKLDSAKKEVPDIHVAVQPRRGARLSPGWLRLHAQSILPAHLVPAKFLVVDFFPESRKELTNCDDVERTFQNPRKKHTTINGPTWKPPATEAEN